MGKKIFLLMYILCNGIYAQQNEGSGVVSYPDNNIKVVGEKIFWSVNPKTDNSSESDLLTVYYKGLYNRRNNYLSGIKGTIDKPGGYIKIEVHAYDSKRAGGLQLLTNDNKTFVTRPIYNVEITQSSPNVFSKRTKEVNYEYWDRGIQIGKISSDDIKTLGAKSSNAVTTNCGSWARNWLRAFSLVSSSCSLEIDEDKLIQLENQPVVVKIAMKDATLMDVRVPALEKNDDLKRITKNEYPYLIIDKVNVEFLEAEEDNYSVDQIKKMMTEGFEWVNKVYTAKTDRVLSAAAVAAGAKIGNPRVVFKNINVTISKAESNAYDLDEIMNGEKEDDIDIATIGDRELFIKYAEVFYSSKHPHVLGATVQKHKTDHEKGLILMSYVDFEKGTQHRLTLAHELGHYFELFHPFTGGCADKKNDGISDTPPAGPVVTQTYKDCIAPLECGGNRRLIENMMDYSGDCAFMFTPGQVEVMRNTIKSEFRDLYTTQLSTDDKIDIVPKVTVRDLRSNTTTRRSTIGGESKKAQSTIRMYPNPVKEILNVYNVENEEYKIFNISGQELLSGITQTGQINVGTLPVGIYVIKVKDITERFIKQ